jgi:hypothetical protein
MLHVSTKRTQLGKVLIGDGIDTNKRTYLTYVKKWRSTQVNSAKV